MAAVSR